MTYNCSLHLLYNSLSTICAKIKITAHTLSCKNNNNVNKTCHIVLGLNLENLKAELTGYESLGYNVK